MDFINEKHEFYDIDKDLGYDWSELDEKIKFAIRHNATTVGAIVYPTKDASELELVYSKYMTLDPNNKEISDTKAIELFGRNNQELYDLIRSKLDIENSDDIENSYTPATESTTIFSNDLPLLTPIELIERIDEDYSCFTESETESIKRWREEYALMGMGIKTENYNKYNLERINILRKAIYENNNDAIIQCGWIPGIEFNSENRVKASNIIREKMNMNNIYTVDDLLNSKSKFEDWVYNSDETIEDVFNRTSLDESYIQEAYIINKEDIYYNKDKFDCGEINLCFITGHSGSGKSTMGRNLAKKDNIEHYELDDVVLNHNFSDENLKEYGDLIYSFFKSTGKKYRNKTNEQLANEFTNYEKEIITDFVKYSLTYCKSHKSTKYVLEGIWLFWIIKPETLKDYAVYIKGTSAVVSLIRAVKRDFKESDKPLKSNIKWTIGKIFNDIGNMRAFENSIENYRKYFSKRMINESYIEETKDYSKLNKKFSKKSGIDFELVDISSSKAKKYIDNDEYLSYNYPYEFLKKNKKSGEIMILKGTNKIIGYVFLSSNTIGNLYINEEYRGYGLSEILLQDAIEKYNGTKLGVFYDNEVAIKLYENFGFKITEERKDRNGEKFYVMELKDKEDKKAVSLVFVAGSSKLAKTIRKVQGTEFSHASISLDDDLNRIYSFNMRNGFNGLTYESVQNYIKEGVTKMGVYTFLVSNKVYTALEKSLDNFNLYINKTKYSVLNLLSIPLNIPLDMDMKMVCSEFVDKLLKTAELDLTNKKSSLVGPRDLIQAANNKSNIVEVFNGDPKNFKHSDAKKKIQKIKKSNLPIYEFVDIADEFINEAKSLPIQFDSNGNLLIKNIKKINFEQEYADSHRLLKEYEKTNSYEAMKFELAKMHFLITLLEKKIYKQGKDKSVNEIKVRARFLNDFKKYLKLINTNEPSFNFTEYFDNSKFNDALIQIDKSTLKFGYEALKYIIK